MPKARPAVRPVDEAYDAGTLWTMTRDEWRARCALWAHANSWELRVTVDAKLLFSKRGAKVHDLFSLAEQWKERMSQSGWKKVTPSAGLTAVA